LKDQHIGRVVLLPGEHPSFHKKKQANNLLRKNYYAIMAEKKARKAVVEALGASLSKVDDPVIDYLVGTISLFSVHAAFIHQISLTRHVRRHFGRLHRQ
jgi:hypothetical protein